MTTHTHHTDRTVATAHPTHRPPVVEREPTALVRAAYLLGPVVLTALLYVGIGLVASREVARELWTAATASLLGLGTAVILGPAALGEGTVVHLSTWDLCALVAYLTVTTAFFFSFNLDLLQRLPWLGPRLRRTRMNAMRSLRERPWVRRWAEIGIGVFVLLPLPGSGSFGGSIAGRMIGLSRWQCFFTVSVAGVLVCLGYGAFGAGVESWARLHQVGLPLRIVTLVAGVALVWVVLKKMARYSRRPPASPSR